MSAARSLTGSIAALAGLDDAARAIIERDARPLRLRPGHVVFEPGQPCLNYVVVKAGSVRVSTVTENGREIVLYRVGPGEACVLTTSCLMSGEDYGAAGVTETDTEAFVIPRPAFDDLLAVSQAFRHFVFTAYGERLQDLIAMVQEVSQRHVDRRLARFLAERRGAGEVAMTHQAIALELGTAREVVSRLLKDFEARGFVRLERGRIVLVNADGLAGFEHGV